MIRLLLNTTIDPSSLASKQLASIYSGPRSKSQIWFWKRNNHIHDSKPHVAVINFQTTTMVYPKQPSAILLRIEAVLRSYANSGMMTS